MRRAEQSRPLGRPAAVAARIAEPAGGSVACLTLDLDNPAVAPPKRSKAISAPSGYALFQREDRRTKTVVFGYYDRQFEDVEIIIGSRGGAVEEIERLEKLDRVEVVGYHQNGKAIVISNGDQDGSEAEEEGGREDDEGE
jgi:hypothetical protein